MAIFAPDDCEFRTSRAQERLKHEHRAPVCDLHLFELSRLEARQHLRTRRLTIGNSSRMSVAVLYGNSPGRASRLRGLGPCMRLEFSVANRRLKLHPSQTQRPDAYGDNQESKIWISRVAFHGIPARFS